MARDAHNKAAQHHDADPRSEVTNYISTKQMQPEHDAGAARAGERPQK